MSAGEALKIRSLILALSMFATSPAASVAVGQLPDQYPKPLIHTPQDHPAAKVILISVEGLRAIDLANWVGGHPQSALAELSRRGVTWTNAHAASGDPVAGLVGLVTGGTPISTGIISSDGYDRTLSPAGSACKTVGATILLRGSLEASKLPLAAAKGCSPVLPHDLLNVNTIFEVVREKIGPTAWADADAATLDLMRGPSGSGLTQACSFPDAASSRGDERRVSAVLHWIDGKDCAGTSDAPAPVLFGMSFTSFAAAQGAAGMGYADGGDTPSAGLAKSLAALDDAMARIISELKVKQAYDSTWIVVAGPYGQSQVERVIPIDELAAAVNAAKAGAVAHISGGDVAMIWLKEYASTQAAAKALRVHAGLLGIADVYYGARLGLTMNLPANDSRMPDIVLQPLAGVLWSRAGDTAIAAHGGMADSDVHVALLVAGKQLTGRVDKTPVPTTQLAPLLLRAFGMEKFDLWALHPEHTPALPGIF